MLCVNFSGMKLLTSTLLTLLLFTHAGFAQSYTENLRAFRTKYMYSHEVVKGKDIQYFNFYPVDSSYKVKASFEKIQDTTGFFMQTSNGGSQQYFKYGKTVFTLNNTTFELFIYQSKALRYTSYKDYLFIPFTDVTTGLQTYGSGRYIDLLIGDIKNDMLTIDFNKAYNPYCAYSAGYQCPVPPKENSLLMSVTAGEKTFKKPYH